MRDLRAKSGGTNTIVAIVALAVAFAGRAEAATPIIGQTAPNFQAQLINGDRIALADLKGFVVVLNFWATWCVPCKRELPLLNTYYDIQKGQGLRVVAVTTEDSVPVSQLKPLADALAISMARKFRGNYVPLGGVPTNYVIDRAGVLRYAKAGAFSLDDLNAILVPLLNEPQPAGTTALPAAARSR